MMAKLGFKQGSGLGSAKNPNARIEPISLEPKEDRSGIGLDSEKKRKFREEVQTQAKKVKAEEGDYRERVAREREDRRLEGLVGAAMRLAEQMNGENDIEAQIVDTEAENDAESDKLIQVTQDEASTERKPRERVSKKLSRPVNILWRSLVREREEKERDRLMRYNLLQSLSRSAKYDDIEEDEQDSLALGGVEEAVEEEDAELDAFNVQEPSERLYMLVEYLRSTYSYCFWCKSGIDGCPGPEEKDHD